MSIEDIIRAIEAERDALQVEIDQRIDLHGLLDRTARQLAEGVPEAPDWGLSTTTQALAAVVDTAPEVETRPLVVAPADTAPKVVAPARTAAPKAGRPGRTPAVDYAAVAAWITRAKADGTYSLAALGAAFGRDEGKVKNWPGECRKRGLISAAAERATCPKCGREFSIFGAATHTANCKGAVAAPAPKVSTIKPTDAQQPSTFATHAKVLACTECDAEFAIDKRATLSTHCITAHKRAPLREELTPVAASGGAA